MAAAFEAYLDSSPSSSSSLAARSLLSRPAVASRTSVCAAASVQLTREQAIAEAPSQLALSPSERPAHPRPASPPLLFWSRLGAGFFSSLAYASLCGADRYCAQPARREFRPGNHRAPGRPASLHIDTHRLRIVRDLVRDLSLASPPHVHRDFSQPPTALARSLVDATKE